jgi:hypothetical protein
MKRVGSVATGIARTLALVAAMLLATALALSRAAALFLRWIDD